MRLLAFLLLLGTVAVVGLGAWKNRITAGEIARNQVLWRSVGRQAAALFQESYYFSREDSYQPGVRKLFEDNPDLLALEFYNHDGHLVERATSGGRSVSPVEVTELDARVPKLISDQLKSESPGARAEAFFRIRWVIPGESVSLVMETRNRTALGLVGGGLALVVLSIVVAGLLAYVFRDRLVLQSRQDKPGRGRLGKFSYGSWPLWLKVFALILVVNFLTALVLFVSISRWQSRDLASRIRREAVLLARFSNPRLVEDFRNHFYDPSANVIFRKSVSRIISVNADLERIRVVSRKTGAVLFTSDLIDSESGGAPLGALERAQWSDAVVQGIEAEGFAVEDSSGDSSGSFKVVIGAADTPVEGVPGPIAQILESRPDRESLYWVEYRFGMRSLQSGVAAVRRELILNLLPVLLLSMALALGLARILSEPLRRLIFALERIGQGDFSVRVEVTRSDEVGQLEDAFNSMTEELRRKQELKKYLSDATYRQVVEASDAGRVPGETGARKLEAAVLFSDIRGFVTHCESSDAEEVLQMLNEYFGEMVTAIYAHGGEVDKFIGDAVLAVFYIQEGDAGEGIEGASCCLRAIQAALEMKGRLLAFNERRKARRKFTIDIGIGISFGRVISGEMGTSDRRDFTVIGDAVNVASRIEKFSKKGRGSKVVFSGGVEERVKGLVGYELLEEAPVAGKEERIRVCELTEIQQISNLIGLLESQDPVVRSQAIDLLALSRNADAIPPVLQSLEDPAESVRTSAAKGLAQLPIATLSEATRESLIARVSARLGQEESHRVLASLILAFGKFCTDLRVLKLGTFLESDRPDRLVANAAEALGQAAARYREVQDLLVPLLSSRSNRVRANVAKALFLAGRHEVLDTLTPMLMHSDPLMRASGVWAMGELASALPSDAPWLFEGLLKSTRSGTADSLQSEVELRQKEHFVRLKPLLAALQGSVPLLVGLLKDPDLRVKRQAISALGKIQDRSALLPLIDSVDFQGDTREVLLEVSQALRSIGAHRLVREVVDRLT